MIEHFLTRNPENEPVCGCGYRPDILDEPAPVGKQWKAKTAVLEHVKAAAPLFALAFQQRSPEAPFHAKHEVRYPRAGVRQTEDGKWLLTLWDGDEIVHVIDQRDRVSNDLATAFSYGWLTVGACWKAGVRLNGMEAS